MADPIFDEAEQRRRTWLIAGVLSLVVVFIGVGASFAVLALRNPAAKKPVFTQTQPIGPSAPATVTSDAPTSSATPTASADSSQTTGTPSGQIVRSGRIAYRLSDQIWVSGEDGSGAKAVAYSASGAFSLSPDGRSLAYMQGASTSTDHAVLVDVASGTEVSLTATLGLPAWAPSSSWLAYTVAGGTGSYAIRRVNRDGTQDSLVTSSAAQPVISPDGKRIAYTRLLFSDTATQSIGVFSIAAHTRKTVPGSLGAVTFAFGSSGVLFFAKNTHSDRTINAVDSALAKRSIIGSLPAGTDLQAPGRLFPSPDASKILFAMFGDDGYSRLTVADVAHKTVKLINTPRRDASPLGWLLDGSGILYIDGNWYLGESPNLYRMNPDGTHRLLLVSGARL
jgi:Tol biopolymer transport system component